MSATMSGAMGTQAVSKSATNGALAGLAGGVVFGMLMGMMNMFPMIGMLVRQDSAIVGVVLHAVISAFIGAVYGVVASRFAQTIMNAAIGGVVNGVTWWVLGALVLMPLGLGMTQMVFVIEQAQWMSLIGHLLYGLVTAFVFARLNSR